MTSIKIILGSKPDKLTHFVRESMDQASIIIFKENTILSTTAIRCWTLN